MGSKRWIRLRVVDNLIFIIAKWTSLLVNFSGKPVMPTLESIMRGSWIADIVFVVNTFEGCWRKPAIFLLVHMLKGRRRVEHLPICIKDKLKESIYFRDTKKEVTMLGIEKIYNQCIKWHSY